jgi:hypothetical protein
LPVSRRSNPTTPATQSLHTLIFRM